MKDSTQLALMARERFCPTLLKFDVTPIIASRVKL